MRSGLLTETCAFAPGRLSWGFALQAYRHMAKSPPNSLFAKFQEKRAKGHMGLKRLPNGEPFIYLWPSTLPPINLCGWPRQSVAQAARNWCEKAWVFAVLLGYV